MHLRTFGGVCHRVLQTLSSFCCHYSDYCFELFSMADGYRGKPSDFVMVCNKDQVIRVTFSFDMSRNIVVLLVGRATCCTK